MVSIVIPIYNAGTYLTEAVDSALRQRVDKELVLVDDCSSDGSVRLLTRHLTEKYRTAGIEGVGGWGQMKSSHSERQVRSVWQGLVDKTKVRIYRNRRRAGVAATRNVGVRLAAGEYIALLDADDRWRAGKLEHQLEALERTGACLCNTARRIIRADGSDTGRVIHTPERITLAMLERTNYINCSSVLASRELLLRYPMEGGNIHEDYLTWLRILSDYTYAVGIDKPYTEYRMSKNGKSRNKLKAAAMTYRTYRRAGYELVRIMSMMACYMVCGVKKHLPSGRRGYR